LGDDGFTVDGNDAVDDECSVALVHHYVPHLVGIPRDNDDHIVDLKLRLHAAGKHHGGCEAQGHGHFVAAEAAGVPFVFGDRFVEGFPCVEYNNYETMYKLVQALYRQGYRKFCYYGEALFFQQNLEDRFGGFRDGLRDIGVPDCDVDVLLSEDLGDSKMRKAYELFQENLESMGMRSDHGKRVVLTSNDLLAQGVISALIRGGIRVPEDVAVFGFDNISIAKYSMPSFSTIVQDPFALGIECFEMLLKRMRNPGEKLENVRLKQKLVLRESSMLDPEIAVGGGLELHNDD